MTDKLSELACLDDLDPDFDFLAGSKEEAKKWVKLIRAIVSFVQRNGNWAATV